MRDCKNCKHYVLTKDGFYACECWECQEEKEINTSQRLERECTNPND